MASSAPPLDFVYFPLWARISPALALEHSGVPWKYTKPEDWKSLKPTTTWACLPMLRSIPAVVLHKKSEEEVEKLKQEASESSSSGPVSQYELLEDIGHEWPILNYIAMRAPDRIGGVSVAEQLVSQQLVAESEDIYQALGHIKNGRVSNEDAKAFWNPPPARGSAEAIKNASTHCKKFGIHVFLNLLEKFAARVGSKVIEEGKFTYSGCTIGECKLFATLYAVVWIEPNILELKEDESETLLYPGLAKFYNRFLNEPATQSIVTGEKLGGIKFAQYFMKPE